MIRFFLSFLVVCGNGAYTDSRVRSFPKGFQFGASTAAYQIEGGWADDGKGLSIWDELVHSEPWLVDDESNGDIAADSYHLYKRDVEMMKELGLDFYRFSVSWPRILPEGFSNKINPDGIKYYNNLINEMLKNNIAPFLTMYHWDLPAPLEKLGGWTNPLIADWFSDYAKVLYDHFGDRVKYWITINEAKQICYEGYGSDMKAPVLNMSGIAEYICAKNILLAHAKAYRLYDEEYRSKQRGWMGISLSCTWFEPATDSITDHQAALDARQFDWGQYANPIFSRNGDWPWELKKNVAAKSAEQGYQWSRLPELSPSEIVFIKGSSDFLGVNSYTSKLAYRDESIVGMFPVPSYRDDMGSILIKNDSWPQGQSTWLQEVPWGFYKLFHEINKLYDNPAVYITENGWSSGGGLVDDDRVHYLRNYLSAMLDAIDEGCNVKGYTAWSMMDNFEWLRGYTEKFGLYEVDFTSPERTRTPRKSAFFYKEVITSRALNLGYEDV